MGRNDWQVPGGRVIGFLWCHWRFWIPALLLSLALLAFLFLSGDSADISPFIYRVN